jgi:hypothetical protein
MRMTQDDGSIGSGEVVNSRFEDRPSRKPGNALFDLSHHRNCGRAHRSVGSRRQPVYRRHEGAS